MLYEPVRLIWSMPMVEAMMIAQIRRMPEGFGEVGGETLIHPVGLTAVLVLGVIMLVVPRRWAVLPMMAIACFIPSAQRIVLFNLDFTLLRIMVAFGVLRLLVREEHDNFQWKPIDKAMLWYVFIATIVYTVQVGTFAALVNRLGFAFDALGLYFLFRCLIRRWEDIDCAVLGTIVLAVGVAVAFGFEHATQRNVFSVFGGVPEITAVRDGKLRCQGPFAHPILAGCFWATLLPLFAGQWWKDASGRVWAVIGVASGVFVIFTCNSSTPVAGLASAIIGGLAFFARRHMREIRWAIACSLLGLHMVMKAPVWHLIHRASSLIGGGTGYHRFLLIDSSIRHFGEWWLLGTRSTAHWGWGLQDVTNQYVLEGVRGGLITLVLFMVVIVLAFRGVGHLWRLTSGHRFHLALSWAMGVGLFVHCMNFIGVSYFGQMHIVWYLVLAMIGSMCPKSERLYREAMTVVNNARLQKCSRAV